MPDHRGGGRSADHRRLGALREDRSRNGGGAAFRGGHDLGVPGSVRGAQGSGQGGEAVADQVRGPLDAPHLREGEDVRHARADARVERASEVHLTVGAQEGETDPRLRPGSEGDERVKISVESAAQVFVVPGGVHDCSPAGTCLHGIT